MIDLSAIERVLGGTLAAIVGGVTAGIALRHADRLRQGGSLHWRSLALDAPTVIGGSLLVWGTVDWLGLSAGQAAAVGTIAGWLGPRATYHLVLGWLRRTGRLPPADPPLTDRPSADPCPGAPPPAPRDGSS